MRKIVINNIGPDITEEKGFWEDNLIGFHKLQGYMKPDNNASFSFTTNAMSFMYHFDGNKFDFQWKSNGRWKYRRSLRIFKSLSNRAKPVTPAGSRDIGQE